LRVEHEQLGHDVARHVVADGPADEDGARLEQLADDRRRDGRGLLVLVLIVVGTGFRGVLSHRGSDASAPVRISRIALDRSAKQDLARLDVLMTVIAGPRTGLEYRAKGKTAITVGRSKTTDFHILDSSMSRVHAVVAKDAEGWFVADQKSRNGVWDGDERVERIRLADGAVFHLGRLTAVRFELVDEDRAMSQMSVPVTLDCARCGGVIASADELVRGADG